MTVLLASDVLKGIGRNLSDEQASALDLIRNFRNVSGPQCFTLQGAAGTGKTTLLAEVARIFPDAFICALSGKAAVVLTRKMRRRAQTLHSFLYLRPDELGGKLSWNRKRHAPGSLKGCILLLDEASMLNEELARDLLETGVLVVACGDPGQLPPVEGNSFFSEPDFTLREIHRQALGSPIIRQAHRVRQGFDCVDDGEGFRVITQSHLSEFIDWPDVILCWRNTTRHRLNAMMRVRRGIDPKALPKADEPLVCLKNAAEVLNGEVFTAAADYRRGSSLILQEGAVISQPWFEWIDTRKASRKETEFGLGYALTVHKAQGSEWPNVLIIDDFNARDDRARWLYTAITRAASSVVIVTKGART